MISAPRISDFDRDIDARKKATRIDRWGQILRFKRKPNKIQRAILMEDLRNILIGFGIIAVVAFGVYGL